MNIDIQLLLTLTGVLSGVILGWKGRQKIVSDAAAADAAKHATIETKLDYMSGNINKMVACHDDYGDKLNIISTRTTRLEEKGDNIEKRMKSVEDVIAKGNHAY